MRARCGKHTAIRPGFQIVFSSNMSRVYSTKFLLNSRGVFLEYAEIEQAKDRGSANRVIFSVHLLENLFKNAPFRRVRKCKSLK